MIAVYLPAEVVEACITNGINKLLGSRAALTIRTPRHMVIHTLHDDMLHRFTAPYNTSGARARVFGMVTFRSGACLMSIGCDDGRKAAGDTVNHRATIALVIHALNVWNSATLRW